MKENFSTYFKAYRDHFCDVVNGIDEKEVQKVVSVILEGREQGRTLFIAGNGGSAACASHFAIDFLQAGQRAGGKPFRVLSLTDNVPILTAISNDEDYQKVFLRQLEPHFSPGDLLFVLSASGNSPNVIEAVKFANQHDGVTIGAVGFDGGELKRLCRYSIHIKTPKGDYGPVEDAFMFLDHLMTNYFAGRVVL